MPFRLSIVLVSVFFLTVSAAAAQTAPGDAQTDCESFPDISWWKYNTHEKVSTYVRLKHDGDWDTYTKKWERQYDKLKVIAGKGNSIVTPTGLKLEGIQLQTYIGQVGKRVEVLRCLEREDPQAQNKKGTDAYRQESETITELPAQKPVTKPTQKALAKLHGSILLGASEAGKIIAKARGCFKCHGENGIAKQTKPPHLAGQKELYLVKQLMEIRKSAPAGKDTFGAVERHNRIMNTIVRKLSEQDVWDVAAYFSGLPCNTGGAPNERPSLADKCVACHGTEGTSVSYEIPNLAGQKKDYLARQLNAFKNSATDSDPGRKDIRFHYFMSFLTQSLSAADMESLAAYYSTVSCR